MPPLPYHDRCTDVLIAISLAGNAYFAHLLFGCPSSGIFSLPGESSWVAPQLFGIDVDLQPDGKLLDLDSTLTRQYDSWAFGHSAARSLGGSSGNSTAHSSSGSNHEHHHQHDALVFLTNAMLIGTAVLHLSSVWPKLQLSIALFVMGMVISLILEGMKAKKYLGVWGDSYDMWMDIDPHLLLFTMLPTLLAGDAMTIDTSVARRVGQQCLYLAGPGVLISAMMTALFLMLLLRWKFLISLVTGSILCATDPVAVVALLKELGASPTLTVQIQGESLLNDGTAIVLYTIAYDILSGDEKDFADMAMFLVKTAIMAVALGVFLGYAFFSWIRATSNRFNHTFPVIQLLLTICAAYWSFIWAEGVFKMSGVLATVGCSLVLAHHMWPHVVDQEAMLDFWHTLENLGNVIIFILGGALVGKAMIRIDVEDYLNLIVIYLFLLLLRFAVIFGSRPILQRLHKDKIEVTVEDALVMTWGGLRGAVGLALGIQVERGRAEDNDGNFHIDEKTANRVLFFVAGVAFLTICVNAATCPLLVDWLGITALPEAEARLLHKFNQQLVSFSMSQDNPAEVTDRLQYILAETAHEILHGRTKLEKPEALKVLQMQAAGSLKIQQSKDIVENYRTMQNEVASIDEESKSKIPILPDDCNGQVERIIDLVSNNDSEPEILKAVNKTFLNIVTAQYRKQIRDGDLRPGSDEADMLFTSLRFGLDSLQVDLVDYEFLNSLVQRKQLKYAARMSHMVTDESMTHANSTIVKVATHPYFNIASAVAIIINVIYVAIEELVRSSSDGESVVWIVFEAIFTFVFLAEFIIKFAHLRLAYFKNNWNNFDLSLVVLGIVGLVLMIVAFEQRDAAQSASKGSNESRVIRIARVLRTMRFLRLFRLFHARLSSDRFISQELTRCIKQMNAMNAFVKAHLDSQKLLVKYFAGDIDEKNEVEMARCVLQSQVCVHKAVLQTVKVHNAMETEMVDELRFTTERKHIVEQLENFVEGALKDGAITSKNAGSLLHPLHHEIHECIVHLEKRRDGYTAPDLDIHGHGHEHGHIHSNAHPWHDHGHAHGQSNLTTPHTIKVDACKTDQKAETVVFVNHEETEGSGYSQKGSGYSQMPSQSSSMRSPRTVDGDAAAGTSKRGRLDNAQTKVSSFDEPSLTAVPVGKPLELMQPMMEEAGSKRGSRDSGFLEKEPDNQSDPSVGSQKKVRKVIKKRPKPKDSTQGQLEDRTSLRSTDKTSLRSIGDKTSERLRNTAEDPYEVRPNSSNKPITEVPSLASTIIPPKSPSSPRPASSPKARHLTTDRTVPLASRSIASPGSPRV